MIIIFMIIIFMMIIMISRSYATLRAEDLDSRASIQFGRVHFEGAFDTQFRSDLTCFVIVIRHQSFVIRRASLQFGMGAF